MSHRAAVLTASAITAFVLVILGGVAAAFTLPQANAAAAPAQALPTVAAPAATVPADSFQPAVSADMAGAIALAAAPGARLTRPPELVMFQGTVAYEVILDQGTVYVDAESGQVLHNGAAQSSWGFGEEDEHEEHEEHEQHEFDDDGFEG